MILDNITADRDVNAYVGGISYDFSDFNLLYAYGDFQGSANTANVSEYIVEQNIALSYDKDAITMTAIYTKQDDKKATGINGGSWNNLRLQAIYNF